MQNLYDEVGSLDKRCYEKFGLSEDILMEHAADGIADFIHKKFNKKSKIIIVCGSGNNGADGLALSRLLHKDFLVSIFYAKEPKSKMAILQNKRVNSISVATTKKITDCDILIDAIVGTGFSGEVDKKLQSLLDEMNNKKAFKIACDIPSCGIFKADITLTMGALKKSMFLDSAKDFVGKIKVLNLGISREIYEKPSSWKLLDNDDIKLPYRDKQDSHKGSFGHLALACGEKQGASIMSAKAALRFGTGLVTLIGFENISLPESLMYSHKLPKNTTALAIGMGLGNSFNQTELIEFLNNDLPLIADADILLMPIILQILKRKNIVLTPHPKEFITLLKLTKLANIDINELQKNRFKYTELFTKAFPFATLLLKGANVIIAKENQFFVNPHGSSILAKGGSGDILSGLIASLLAQGYSPLEAAITASLTHTKLASKYKGANFSLVPDDLIELIAKL